MSQNTEQVPFRTQLKVSISNFLQKYRTLLVWLVVFVVLVVGGLAIWTQVDSAMKADFAKKIEVSQQDYVTWAEETDASKKSDLGKALEADLSDIQKSAPQGYGLSKAWYIQGNYYASQKRWADAAKAYHTVYEKDKSSYLAPISLVNSGVSLEESGDIGGALSVYSEFEKSYITDGMLAPQVFFTEGRLLEVQKKSGDAVIAYKKLIEKFPESTWTKLGRDRILLLSQE